MIQKVSFKLFPFFYSFFFKASLGSLFQHIATKDEEGLHKKALEFLNEKVIPALGSPIKQEIEEYISKEIQKVKQKNFN